MARNACKQDKVLKNKNKQTNKQNINVQWRQQDLINLIPLSSLVVQFLIWKYGTLLRLIKLKYATVSKLHYRFNYMGA